MMPAYLYATQVSLLSVRYNCLESTMLFKIYFPYPPPPQGRNPTTT